MPHLNRRGFLQAASAASLAPLLPALPAAAASRAAPASVSKALWSGIYSKAGSKGAFVHAARTMGLSNSAIQGVGARSVGVRIALASTTQPVAQQIARRTRLSAAPKRLVKSDALKSVRKLNAQLDRLLDEDETEPTPPQ